MEKESLEVVLKREAERGFINLKCCFLTCQHVPLRKFYSCAYRLIYLTLTRNKIK